MLKVADNPPLVFPETLFDDGLTSQRWWVGHTKARCEKAFAWDLSTLGVGYFLPMVERISFSGGRKRRGMNALFPSYVFFRGGEDARYRALVTGRLCQVIPVPNQGKLVEELRQIHLALRGSNGEAVLDPYPFAVIGQRCRVKAGPFTGVEGTVVERQTLARLVLEVSLLGQAVALQIDTDLLEAVGEPETLYQR